MRTIAVINLKGGVGKTTTTANLAHALAMGGKKVAAIDLDPQGHLGTTFGVYESLGGVDEALLGSVDLENQAIQVRDGLRFVPAGSGLVKIDQLTEGGADRGNLLRTALKDQFLNEDFVIIDCPPSSGLLVVNALFAIEEILAPLSSDYLALQGISRLMEIVKKFEKSLNKQYKMWFVMARYYSTRRLSKNVLNLLLKHFPGQLLATLIRETAVLAECPIHGKTILERKPTSRSAMDFHNLAGDLLDGRVM